MDDDPWISDEPDEWDEDLQDPYIACPKCGSPIYDDIEQCPVCHAYLSPSDFERPKSIWSTVIVVLLVISFVLWSLTLI